MVENKSKKRSLDEPTNTGTANERGLDGDMHKPTKGIPRAEK
ncbi:MULTISPECIES: hypothetical protein [Clostridium]|nr:MULTISPECIES: hypothetical protein [Clostridium]